MKKKQHHVLVLPAFTFLEIVCLFVCLFGFLTSSSTTRLYRGRAPRQERLTILRAATHETELGDHDFCLSRSHYTFLEKRQVNGILLLLSAAGITIDRIFRLREICGLVFLFNCTITIGVTEVKEDFILGLLCRLDNSSELYNYIVYAFTFNSKTPQCSAAVYALISLLTLTVSLY